MPNCFQEYFDLTKSHKKLPSESDNLRDYPDGGEITGRFGRYRQ